MHTLIDVSTGKPPADRKKVTAGFPRGFDHTLDVSDQGLAWAATEQEPSVGAFERAVKADVATKNADGTWSYKWTVSPIDPVRIATMVKRECKRRILAAADAETQQNIAQAGILYSAFRLNGLTEADALAQAGLIAGDMTKAAAFRGWVAAMSDTAAALITAGDDSYQDDSHWPAVPDGVLELAGRF